LDRGARWATSLREQCSCIGTSIWRLAVALHVIVGAGAVGVATARLLAERGDQVRMVSRRGTGLEHPSVERVAADATDSAAIARLAHGAVALYNSAAPPYHRWSLDWPPLAAALLDAAEACGAVLVSAGNLYLYGPDDGPLTEELPARPGGPRLASGPTPGHRSHLPLWFGADVVIHTEPRGGLAHLRRTVQ
jgi:hypothetical protein